MGYIVAGYTYGSDGDISDVNNGDSDYWIVKLDSIGNKMWDKTFGGTGLDYARSIRQTSDGGYIVVGESFSNDGDVSVPCKLAANKLFAVIAVLSNKTSVLFSPRVLNVTTSAFLGIT